MSGKPLILGLLLLLMGSGCTFPLRGQDNEPPVPVYRDSLNVYITNELSEIPELQPMDVAIDSFMDFWTLHGVSLAIVRNDSLVYAKGYGKADASTPMTPGTTLRMASVSKLLTAIGIMKLQEEGKLFLDTPVFGPLGILGKYDSYIKDDNYYLITIEHLLRHQAGFTTRGGDPVFSPWTDLDALLKKQLGRRLSYEPGTWQEYSNFGFLLLSLVIEEVSGKATKALCSKRCLNPTCATALASAAITWPTATPANPATTCSPTPKRCLPLTANMHWWKNATAAITLPARKAPADGPDLPWKWPGWWL